jgi:hypothetical protein
MRTISEKFARMPRFINGYKKITNAIVIILCPLVILLAVLLKLLMLAFFKEKEDVTVYRTQNILFITKLN